jgi:hypothetical protein
MKNKHVTAEYNGKTVSMDYIEKPQDEFRYACMRIRDNNAKGIVTDTNGKKYMITKKSKVAKLIKEEYCATK